MTTHPTTTPTRTPGHSYSDIIESRAWYDDDHDSWNIEHLWIYCNGRRTSYSTCDSDGNHEPCGKRDAVDFCKHAHDSWCAYDDWCARHGEDPLGQYMVEYHTVTQETWIARLRGWVGAGKYGLAIVSARQPGKKSISPRDLPKHVKEYLCMKGRKVPYCDGVTSWDMLTGETVSGKGIERTVRMTIEHKVPRKDVKQQIRAIAGRVAA